MKALILAAGYGTRLYPLAEKTPKALLPVRGKPILGYVKDKLDLLGAQVREVGLVSNHRYAANFRRWIAQHQGGPPWRVLDDGSTSEQNRLGSMGDLAFAIRSLRIDDDLLVLGSDNLFQGDLGRFLAFTRVRQASVTLGAYELPERALACRYGVLTVDAQGRIRRFEEKPKRPRSCLVSMAVYFFPRPALDLVIEYVRSSSSTDTLGSFVRWLLQRVPVFAYPFQGLWYDIGDMTSYTRAQETFTA